MNYKFRYLIIFLIFDNVLSNRQLNLESVEFANQNRQKIIFEINQNQLSSWQAEVPKRFFNTSYNVFIRDGSGILNGKPSENDANLPIKTFNDMISILMLKGIIQEIPDSFNSVEQWGNICPQLKEIQDQSACGSCYAVSAASAATDRFCIAKNGNFTGRLSATDLMSCCFTCKGSNGGCYGGTPSHCWDYMTQQGIASGGSYGDSSQCLQYPFPKCSHHINGTFPQCPSDTYDSPSCFWKCDDQSSSKETYDQSQANHIFKSSYKIENNEKAIQADIMAHGPVQASMYLVAEFEVYKSGVFTTQSQEYVGAHAVKIVGWGIDQSSLMKYWLVQNSWNEQWGEQGYFRIERGKNVLSIEDSVVAGIVI